MELNEMLAAYKAKKERMNAYGHALWALQYDSETAMPAGAAPELAPTYAILGEEVYKMQVDPELKRLMQQLLERRDQPDFVTLRECEEGLKELERTEKIPMEEYVAYQVAQTQAVGVWKQAKATNDFALFAPHLKTIIDYNRRFAGYWDSTKPAYDVLLDQYEKGLTMEELDRFFGTLRKELLPVIEAIGKKGSVVDDSFTKKPFPLHKQRELSDYLMQVMTIDRNYCSIGETEHPFTSNQSKHNVRITTHYHENAFLSSMYSVIHEGGHALYELHTGNDLIGSPMGGGCSMGLHESQSRFYENIIGRSEAFISYIYPALTALNPEQFEGISAHDMYLAANVAMPSLIRTEADELTYSFHVMVRYELEKRLIEGSLSVEVLPQEWNRLYKEYLGIDVPNDSVGVLQDSHWSGGNLGYFPSYAIGSAYSAQILASMEKELSIWELVGKGELKPIVEWLTERIYQYGRLLTPKELLNKACGADFDPSFYSKYLKDKFTSVYEL